MAKYVYDLIKFSSTGTEGDAIKTRNDLIEELTNALTENGINHQLTTVVGTKERRIELDEKGVSMLINVLERP